MKVKFIVQLGDSEINEVVKINEDKIKGTGYMPKRKMEQILHDWQDAQITSFYKIINDDRFDDSPNNVPYVDYVTSRRLGWLE